MLEIVKILKMVTKCMIAVKGYNEFIYPQSVPTQLQDGLHACNFRFDAEPRLR